MMTSGNREEIILGSASKRDGGAAGSNAPPEASRSPAHFFRLALLIGVQAVVLTLTPASIGPVASSESWAPPICRASVTAHPARHLTGDHS